MSRRSIKSLTLGLAVLFLTTLGSSRAFGQLMLYNTPIFYLNPIYPQYVTLPVDRFVSTTTHGSSTLVTIISGGREVTLDFNPASTSWCFDPISSDMSQIMLKILEVAGSRPHKYAITLTSFWNWGGTTYHANYYSRISFTSLNVQQWNGIDSVVSGSFGDLHGYKFGQLVLRRFGSSGITDHDYYLIRQSITGSCDTISPLRLDSSSACSRNDGVLDLLQDALPWGGIEIEDYCHDPNIIGPGGKRARLVHCGSYWFN